MKVKFTKRHGRVQPEVVWITQLEPADPREIRLVKVRLDKLETGSQWSGREVHVERGEDTHDGRFLLGGEERDATALCVAVSRCGDEQKYSLP